MMDDCLFSAPSGTRVQYMLRLLGQCGIPARIVRMPVGLAERGCAYGVRVRKEDREAAQACLSQMQSVRLFCRESGAYREWDT